jgi:hypothetical protein
MQNPKFSTVVGLVLDAEANNQGEVVQVNNKDTKNDDDIIGRLGSRLSNVFKELF